MSKFFPGVFIAMLFFALAQTGLTSCTKTNTVTDTVTVTHIDTVLRKDTLVTAEILTANSWKVQEDRAMVANSPVFYQRGGSSNTINLDNEYITFNTDHTGLYFGADGNSYSLTWDFVNATSIEWDWNFGPTIHVVWEHVYFKNGALHYDEYYTMGGNNVLGAIIRVPK